jgi:hypothetical protein
LTPFCINESKIHVYVWNLRTEEPVNQRIGATFDHGFSQPPSLSLVHGGSRFRVAIVWLALNALKLRRISVCQLPLFVRSLFLICQAAKMLHQMWNRFVAIMSIVTLVTLWRQMWWIIRTERKV